MHLNEVDVVEIDDDDFQGHKYVFRFAKNNYFEDTELFKEFKYSKGDGNLIVNQTPIKWKPGMNLCDPQQVIAMGKQAGKKRSMDEDLETSGFFAWFAKDNEDEEFIGQPMKEIWEEPVKYFAGDVDDFDDDLGSEDDDEDEDEE